MTALTNVMNAYNTVAAQTTTHNTAAAKSFQGINQSTPQNQPSQPQTPQQNNALAQSHNALNQSFSSVAAGANTASAGVDSMHNSLQNTLQSARALGAQAPAISAHMGGAVAAANAEASALGSSMGAAGAAASHAMASGIASGSGSVASAAASTTSAGVSSSKGAAGVSSPSVPMSEIGMWMGVGLALGLSNSVSMVAGAASQLALSGVSATNGAVQANYNTALAGGFGAGIAAASNGVTPIAQSYGLMVGSIWAENVATGAENVLQSSQYGALVVPQFGSALAQTSLGAEGLLPPAGSGAEYYTTTSGSAGLVSMAPVVNATILVNVDGGGLSGSMRVISQQVVDASYENLNSSIGNQRGG
jgi:hypothetical protein